MGSSLKGSDGINTTSMKAIVLTALMFGSVILVQAEASEEQSIPLNHAPECNAQREHWTVGLISCTNESHGGYTLFSPFPSNTSYLIDEEGREINSWRSPGEHRPGASAYMLSDGSLLRTGNIGNESPGNFSGGGIGGTIERIGWDGTLMWSWDYSSTSAITHHDIEPLPNGNILAIAWEDRSEQEALQAGRDPAIASDSPGGQGNIWPDQIIEIEPVGSNDANIVWRWHAWDHLVQDYDPTKDNYGAVEEHPELLNINYVTQSGNQAGRADWMHCNSIDYNAELDQIMISCRGMDEFYIIDHSTTTEEAAGHEGGTYGKGGDFLYRWGNPQVYQKGLSSDQQLFGQHDVQWIEEGHTQEGNIILFNNGAGRSTPYSTVEILNPDHENGHYSILTNGTFGPLAPSWTWSPEGMYAPVVSGAQGLSNGNVMVTIGTMGALQEVSPDGEVVWSYINPIGANGTFQQSLELPPGNLAGTTANMLFKGYRYEADHPGLADKNLTPGSYLEHWTDTCPEEYAWKWDRDGNGCIDDSDADGIMDPYDRCWIGDDLLDLDQDGLPDACDAFVDSDLDGVRDSEDRCEGFDDGTDQDNDGVVDGCDDLIDSDGDGTADALEQCPGSDDSVDSDGDGVPDGCDSTPSGITTTDGNDTNATLNVSIEEQQNNSEPTPTSRSGLFEEITSRSALGYLLMAIGTWMLIYLVMTGRSRDDLLPNEGRILNENGSTLAQADHLEKTLTELSTPDADTPRPLPATGLPEGWTIEQWNFYGHQWNEMNEE